MRQIIIVSCVVFFLSLFVLLTTESQSQCSRFNYAQTDLHDIQNALDLFQKETGNLPNTETGISVLYNSIQRYLFHPMLDPWHRPYIYKSVANNSNYILYSIGKNGIDEAGNGDDLTTWEKSYSYADYGVGFPGTMYNMMPHVLVYLFLLSLLIITICSIIYLIKLKNKPEAK